jgi:hypothetical protein
MVSRCMEQGSMRERRIPVSQSKGLLYSWELRANREVDSCPPLRSAAVPHVAA